MLLEFCTFSEASCYSMIAVSTLPPLSLLISFLFTLRKDQNSHDHLQSQAEPTKVSQLSKQLSIAKFGTKLTLALAILITSAFLLTYNLIQDEEMIVTMIFEGCQILNFAFVLILLNHEYSKKMETANYIRLNWLFSLIVHSYLVIELYFHNYDQSCFYMRIIQTAFLFILNIIGLLFKKDLGENPKFIVKQYSEKLNDKSIIDRKDTDVSLHQPLIGKMSVMEKMKLEEEKVAKNIENMMKRNDSKLEDSERKKNFNNECSFAHKVLNQDSLQLNEITTPNFDKINRKNKVSISDDSQSSHIDKSNSSNQLNQDSKLRNDDSVDTIYKEKINNLATIQEQINQKESENERTSQQEQYSFTHTIDPEKIQNQSPFLLSESQFELITEKPTISRMIKDSVISVETESHFGGSIRQIDREITKISIDGFKEIKKFGKKTVVFVILYENQKYQQTKVYRSFREFSSLQKDMVRVYPDELFPPWPHKKDKNDLLTFQDLKERKNALEVYIKHCVERELLCHEFRNFLNPNEKHFKSCAERQMENKNIDVNNLNFQRNNIDVNLVQSLKIEPQNSEKFRVIAKHLQQSLMIQEEEQESESVQKRKYTLSDEENKNMNVNPKRKQTTMANFSSNEKSSCLTSEQEDDITAPKQVIKKTLTIDIPVTNTIEKTTFYGITVKDMTDNEIGKISKRYNDFKSLHLSMKSELKSLKLKKKVIELPDKGDLGIMTANNDHNLIRYRKEALKNYLQAIADDVVLLSLKCVEEFLGLDKSDLTI